MNCFQKLKSLYVRKGLLQKDLANEFNMSKASFNNKMVSCDTRFNIRDLIRYADYCSLKIAFIDDNNNIIETLNINDIEQSQTKKT